MKSTPFGGLSAVVSRLQIVTLLLCSAKMGFSSSGGAPQLNMPRVHAVDNDDFNLPHGEQLNRVRFLTDGERTVEIPAGSLLHLPLHGRIRIAHRPVKPMVDWKDFFAENTDAISQVGASRQQLRGERQIHAAVFTHLQQSGMVGVAIAAGRPVALPQPS